METTTLVFTDIEGSTRLLREGGPEVFAGLLARHRQVLAEAWAEHGGIAISVEGDGSLVLFPHARDALAGASLAQVRLGQQAWDGGTGVRVRMGVHTGQVRRLGDGVVGLAVHVAARVAAAAHGGQVVLTDATAEQAGIDVSAMTVDLGQHWLKDLDGPVRLRQLVVPGSSRRFPRLRSLPARSHNLPAQRTPFVGREATVRRGLSLLRSGRLVTLTGPGGVGKTRLACEIAATAIGDHNGGVWFVRLDAATTAADVRAAVTRAVHPVQGPGRGLAQTLAGVEALLVLDNAEHVLDAVADLVEELLTGCPGVRLLVTSQEALRLLGERVLPVAPLCRPGQPVDADAVRIFVDAVLRVSPEAVLGPAEQAAVERICLRLDGLPLALELAAAQVTGSDVLALADRVERVIELPAVRGGAPRQRSVQAALAWSHDLLTDTERAVFRRLAVFTAEGDLDLAETVCGGAGVARDQVAAVLESLSRKNLVVWQGGGSWRLLFVIAAFAREQLVAAGEQDELEHRHALAVAEMCREVEESVLTSRRNALVARTVAQQSNLVAALERTLDAGTLTPAFRPVILCLNRVFMIGGDLRTAERLLPRLADSPVGARALAGLAWLHMWNGVNDCVKEACAAVRLARRQDDAGAEAEAWRVLGYVALERRRLTLADEAFRRSRALARGINEALWLNGCALHADVFPHRGHPRCAAALLERTLELAEPSGNGQILGQVHTRLAHVRRDEGDLDAAVGHARRAIDFQQQSGYGGTAVGDSLLLVTALAEQGRDRDALVSVGDALAMVDTGPGPTWLPAGYRGVVALLASLACRAGQARLGAQPFAGVLALTSSVRPEAETEDAVAAALAALAAAGCTLPAVPADVRVVDVVRVARDACRELLA